MALLRRCLYELRVKSRDTHPGDAYDLPDLFGRESEIKRATDGLSHLHSGSIRRRLCDDPYLDQNRSATRPRVGHEGGVGP